MASFYMNCEVIAYIKKLEFISKKMHNIM